MAVNTSKSGTIGNYNHKKVSKLLEGLSRVSVTICGCTSVAVRP